MSFSNADLISLASAGFSGLAFGVSIYAARLSQRMASSGFQSAERVKLDTALLLSALRGLMIKSALYTQQDPQRRDDPGYERFIDTKPELAALQTFFTSSTAIAYYTLVTRKSKEARDAGVKGEVWRTFFLMIGELLNTRHPYHAGVLAARIEKMFDSISDAEFEQISADLEELVPSIRRILCEREHDVLLHVLIDRTDADRTDDSVFENFIAHLRLLGINDPDIDMFWSVINGQQETLEDAVARGAKVHTTSGEIINRYRKEWEAFKTQANAALSTEGSGAER